MKSFSLQARERSSLTLVSILVCALLLAPKAVAADVRQGPSPSQVQAWKTRFSKPAIPASADGRYQLQRDGKRFLMVYEPSGAPIVAFDLSLTPISTVEMILGGIGFGDLNLYKLIQAIKKAHQAGRDAAAMEDQAASEAPESDATITKMLNTGSRDARDVIHEFKKIRLSDEWAARNSVTKPDPKPGVPIPDGASFTLADLVFKDSKVKQAFLKLFIPLMNAVDQVSFWNESNIQQALKELELRAEGKGGNYQMVWNHQTRVRPGNGLKEINTFPGYVMDFYNPRSTYQYKAGLMRLSQDLSQLKNIGPIGMVVSTVVNQMVNGVVDRLEYHEHQFIAILEAMERFEYPLEDFPPELLQSTLSVMYANTLFAPLDGDSSQEYVDARVQGLTYQEKAKGAIMAKLSKELPATDTVTLFGGNKFALVRNQKPGFKAVMGSAIQPHWLFRYAAKHVDGKSPELTYIARETATAASALARALLPAGYAFRIGQTSVGISVDPMIYEMLIRSPMVRERYMEGELAALLDEAIAGRATLPLTDSEAKFARASLQKTMANAFEIFPEDEDATIEAYYEWIKGQIGRGQFKF